MMFINQKQIIFNSEFRNKIKKFNIFFITSPNTTHFKYLKRLSKKYIFCEKPQFQIKRFGKIKKNE